MRSSVAKALVSILLGSSSLLALGCGPSLRAQRTQLLQEHYRLIPKCRAQSLPEAKAEPLGTMTTWSTCSHDFLYSNPPLATAQWHDVVDCLTCELAEEKRFRMAFGEDEIRLTKEEEEYHKEVTLLWTLITYRHLLERDLVAAQSALERLDSMKPPMGPARDPRIELAYRSLDVGEFEQAADLFKSVGDARSHFAIKAVLANSYAVFFDAVDLPPIDKVPDSLTMGSSPDDKSIVQFRQTVQKAELYELKSSLRAYATVGLGGIRVGGYDDPYAQETGPSSVDTGGVVTFRSSGCGAEIVKSNAGIVETLRLPKLVKSVPDGLTMEWSLRPHGTVGSGDTCFDFLGAVAVFSTTPAGRYTVTYSPDGSSQATKSVVIDVRPKKDMTENDVYWRFLRAMVKGDEWWPRVRLASQAFKEGNYSFSAQVSSSLHADIDARRAYVAALAGRDILAHIATARSSPLAKLAARLVRKLNERWTQ